MIKVYTAGVEAVLTLKHGTEMLPDIGRKVIAHGQISCDGLNKKQSVRETDVRRLAVDAPAFMNNVLINRNKFYVSMKPETKYPSAPSLGTPLNDLHRKLTEIYDWMVANTQKIRGFQCIKRNTMVSMRKAERCVISYLALGRVDDALQVVRAWCKLIYAQMVPMFEVATIERRKRQFYASGTAKHKLLQDPEIRKLLPVGGSLAVIHIDSRCRRPQGGGKTGLLVPLRTATSNNWAYDAKIIIEKLLTTSVKAFVGVRNAQGEEIDVKAAVHDNAIMLKGYKMLSTRAFRSVTPHRGTLTSFFPNITSAVVAQPCVICEGKTAGVGEPLCVICGGTPARRELTVQRVKTEGEAIAAAFNGLAKKCAVCHLGSAGEQQWESYLSLKGKCANYGCIEGMGARHSNRKAATRNADVMSKLCGGAGAAVTLDDF